jgi:hypothetical protein
MDDLDNGNSLIRREDNKPSEGKRPPREIEQFSGVAQMKKKQVNSFFSWISRMFFSGKTWKEILRDVIENQVVPELKQGARDALVSVIDMKFDKDFTPGPSSTVKTVNNGSFVTQYLDYSKASTQAIKQELEANQKKEEEIRKSGYELPAFQTRDQANAFLASMHAEVSRFGDFSVHDLAMKQGKKVDWTWEAYGWTKEQILAVKKPTRLSKPIIVNGVRYNYIIELPAAKMLEG